MFHLVAGLPWLIVLVRFILPLPWPWTLKAVLAVVLLIASQYHYVSRLSSGSVFAPEFPRPLVIAFNVLFGAIVLLAVFQIALDAGHSLALFSQVIFPNLPQRSDMPQALPLLSCRHLASTGPSSFHRSRTSRFPSRASPQRSTDTGSCN